MDLRQVQCETARIATKAERQAFLVRVSQDLSQAPADRAKAARLLTQSQQERR